MRLSRSTTPLVSRLFKGRDHWALEELIWRGGGTGNPNRAQERRVAASTQIKLTDQRVSIFIYMKKQQIIIILNSTQEESEPAERR